MSHSASSGSITPRWLAWTGLFLAIVSFGLGLFGFAHEKHEPLSNAIFQSLQLFHLHFHSAHGETVPLVLDIARFGAATVGLGLLPAILVLAFFRTDISHFWVRRFWRNHIVICGHCPRTLNLVRDLMSALTSRRVALISDAPLPASEIPEGVFYLESHGHAAHALHCAAVHRAQSVVSINSEDRANIEILVAVEKLCAHRTAKFPLECHIHLQDNHLKGGLHRHIDNYPSRNTHIRQQFFNSYEIVARNLACQFPLPETLVDTEIIPEHYVIVGFAQFGQNVALRLLKMGQKLVRFEESGSIRWQVVKPKLTIIDPLGDVASTAFLLAHPALSSMCLWSQDACSCETAHFLNLKFLDDSTAPERVSIIFAIEDEAVSLRAALLLQETCQNAPTHHQVSAIYLRVADPGRLGKIGSTITSPQQAPPLIFFAPDRDVFSADAILRYSVDVLARAVHEAYLSASQADRRDDNKPTAADCDWETLSEADRESSRESADHMWAKLRTLGYRLTPVGADEIVQPTDAALLEEIASREDELARVEHYRWMTWRLLTGWTLGTPRDNRKKHHPDLVEYEHLPPATKEKDKVIIRAIPTLLIRGRLKAERM